MLALCLLAACQRDQGEESDADTALFPLVSPAAGESPAPTQSSEQAARAEALALALAERQASGLAQSRPGQGELLRDQMLERRREVLAEREAGPVRSTRRMLSPRSQWWQDQALATELSLSAQQIQAVADAAAELERVRSRSRHALATGQRELLQALATGSADLAREQVDQRRDRAIDLAEAEAAWLEALVNTLTAEQLATLARQHPQLIMAGAAERSEARVDRER
ncbi:MAG: hypothetical protein LAT56_00425 [Wenzhouxiangella sp.]|nr:hypothetical protein [Wenzhouxiangella sp.]